MFSLGPSMKISTVSSGRFLTKPLSFRDLAACLMRALYPTPCVMPSTRILALAIFYAFP